VPEVSAVRVQWRRLLILGACFATVVAGAVVFWPTMRVTAYLTDARRAISGGDFKAALRYLELADRLQRRRAAVQYLLGVAKRREGRIDEAVVHLQTAAELGWDVPAIERQMWLTSAQRGDLPGVRQQLMEAVQSEVNNEAAEEIYEAFAKGCLATYQLHDAWICVDLWLQWRPEAIQARVLRAAIREQLGDYQDACDDYRTVLDIAPDNREARMRLAKALVIRQEHDAARREFEACASVTPDDADAWLGLAQCARRAGDTAKAHEYLDRLFTLKLTPQQRGTTLGELGKVLLDEGKTEEAVEPLRLALTIVPGDANIHHALGTALARLGRAEEAAFHHARMQHLRKQFDRLTQITGQLTDDPGNADLRCEAGAIMMDAGLKKEGADWLRTALRCDPDHRRAHELLADYFAEIGDQATAGRHRLWSVRPVTQPASDPPVADRGADSQDVPGSSP
jgi:tetratricopeptide (TPR) repeat protein